MEPSKSASPEARRLANRALLAAAAVYGGYALLGLVGVPGEVRGLALVAAFYFLPGLLLKRDPRRQARYQVGPESPVPPFHRSGWRVALVAVLVVFPPFVLAFFWFYSRVCPGDLTLLTPVLAVEGLTPWAGGLEAYLDRLCGPYGHTFWPEAFRIPGDWLRWFGMGAVYQVALEVFVVALPEEVFHRGYLMSALEERWPARRKVLGTPFGLAAVLSSLVFAVGHLVGMAEVARLATFFPALLFAWLWRRANSLWAPALFHAASNVLMAMLIASTFPR